MRNVWTIAAKDIKESLRSKGTYLYIAVLFILTISYYTTYNAVINRMMSVNPDLDVIIQASQGYLNSIAGTIPMMYAIFICTIFATYSVVVDKSKRNIECLMSTPVSLRQIWMGKALSVSLPSLLIALGVSIISYIVMNSVLIMPRTGVFIIPDIFSLITAFILTPILIFIVVSLVIYLQLIISNPRIANFAFTGIFLLIFFGANTLTAMGIEVNYGYIYLLVIVVLGCLALVLSQFLTRERVVLTSKG